MSYQFELALRQYIHTNKRPKTERVQRTLSKYNISAGKLNKFEKLARSDPKKDPALVRDLIVLIKGPEKGKTGIVIGLYMDGSDACAVKLDRNKGIREIRVVPRSWAAKRLGEQEVTSLL